MDKGYQPMKHTLLIYSEVPEDTKFYLIPDRVIREEHRALLNESHGRMINSDDMNNGMSFVSNAICKEEKFCDDTTPKEWHCIWAKYQVEMVAGQPFVAMSDDEDWSITSVVHTGFIL
jgi:hypothetical protein